MRVSVPSNALNSSSFFASNLLENVVSLVFALMTSSRLSLFDDKGEISSEKAFSANNTMKVDIINNLIKLFLILIKGGGGILFYFANIHKTTNIYKIF
jgi:hypothetical protein